MFLDANAGLTPDENALSLFTKIITQINNINGFTNDKILYHKLIQEQTEQLKYLFGFDHLFILPSSSSALQMVIDKIPNLEIIEHQHPKVKKMLKNNLNDYPKDNLNDFSNNKSNATSQPVLINLLTSEWNIDQSYQIKDYEDRPYIIVDATQAIGRLNLPTQDEVSCMFFSGKKIKTVNNICYMFTSDLFYKKYFNEVDQKSLRDPQGLLLRNQDYFDFANFISSFDLVRQNYKPNSNKEYNKIIFDTFIQILSSITDIQLNIPKDSSKLNYTSIVFSLKDNLCPRSLQKALDDENIQIGFATACQSNTSGDLRLSWRLNVNEQKEMIEVLSNNINQIQAKFISSINKVKLNQTNSITNEDTLTGSSRANTDAKENLKQFNSQQFYLYNHWVKSNNGERKTIIPDKYEDYFDYNVINQKNVYYLYVPELMKEYKQFEKENQELELDSSLEEQILNSEKVLTKEDSSKEDSSDESTSLTTQFEYIYRVSKNIYLTPFGSLHSDNLLTLENFKKQEFPDDFVFLYEKEYLMTKPKYEWCKKHQINLKKEYVNNPMSQFVLQLNLHPEEIEEHYINEPNSYKNNMKYVSKKEIRDKIYFKKEKEDKSKDKPTSLAKLHLLQPYKSSLNNKAIETALELKKQGQSSILILKNLSVEDQQTLLNNKFIEEKTAYKSFNNWYQQWYYDSNIQIFHYKVK